VARCFRRFYAAHPRIAFAWTGRNLGLEVAASASPSTLLGPELVERASGRRFQIHPPFDGLRAPSLPRAGLVATNQMPFPRRL